MAAKTYKEVNPSDNVVILEKFPTIGGVWAEHKLYPGLKTNNTLGTFEYSDFPMTTESAAGITPGGHIPGQSIHNYLKNFARKFGIYEHCRFGEEVKTARKTPTATGRENGWLLTIYRGDVSYTLKTRRLIVATGLHSQEFMPKIAGAEDFSADIIHASNLLEHSERLFANAKTVTVIGGTKSAWDAAFSFAWKGIHVDMVIRESGHGPCWIAPSYVTPFKRLVESLVSTRILSWMSPCIWGDADGFTGIRRFLHGTAVGRVLVNSYWTFLGKDILAVNGYDKHPETAKLKPWGDPFWIASGLSVLNYPSNFFEFVREGRISVHVADISRLSNKQVHLTSTKGGDFTIFADALLCATGFKRVPSIEFLTETGKPFDAITLGFPHRTDAVATDDELIQEVDKEILTRFPRLKDQPTGNPQYKPLVGGDENVNESADINRPYILHRFMVPPAFINDRTIAYSGMVQTVFTALVSQSQALWITAYFGGKLKTKLDLDRAKKEAILHARFGRWRCPGGPGGIVPDFYFDSIPYVDLLLGDLGLNMRRKAGMVKEMFEPYGASDYIGLVEEWKNSLMMKKE